MENVLQVIRSYISGNTGDYSKSQASEAIRNALIEMNGGSKKLDLKKFHRGSEMYALIEELIPALIDEGFKEDDAIFNLVEYRNIAEGDEQEFDIEGGELFVVADAAKGIKGVRRQRIDNMTTVTVPTATKVIRVYEELNRFLAGKIDFDKLAERIAKSYKQQTLEDAYNALAAVTSSTAGLDSSYVVGGSAYADDALLEIVEHVEAATGKPARIYGTKSALRKLQGVNVSDEAKSDLYNLGYYGKFNGTDCVCMRQVHKPGTSSFALDNKKVYVIATDDRPIKVVNEGEGMLHEGDPFDNADLTKEYAYIQSAGVAVVCSQKMGVYSFT